MGFDGGTALDVSKDAHIHDLRYDLSADGKIRAELTNYAKGQAAGKIQFEVSKK